MNMTHYMSLLSDNQPWNLLIFMAIPVICAEALTISEFFIIFDRKKSGILRTFNKIVGIFDGLYFSGIFIYLLITVVIPLTQSGGWHGVIDIVAVAFYLGGVIFLLPITLMELKIIFRSKTIDERMKIHFILISGFLLVSHIAMIFGMINPELISSMPNMH